MKRMVEPDDARERENIDENKGDRDIKMKSYREMWKGIKIKTYSLKAEWGWETERQRHADLKR